MFAICRNCNLRFRDMSKRCSYCGRRTDMAIGFDIKPKPEMSGGGEELPPRNVSMHRPVIASTRFRALGHPIRLAGTKPGERKRIKSD